MAIGGYCWLLYYKPYVVILLLAINNYSIGDYSIGGYFWLF